jgi:hypothetical protein
MNHERTRVVVVLLNNGFDPTGPLKFTLRAQIAKLWQVKSSGERVPLPLTQTSDGLTVATDRLPAWQTTLLTGE